MTLTENEPKLKDGRVVVAIAGPVVDIDFPHDAIPEINHAVEMTIDVAGSPVVVTAEVAEQLGHGRGPFGMKPTDGLTRGAVVTNTGRGITVPVGEQVLGHIFNVLGEPLDVDASTLAGLERVGHPPRSAPVRPARARADLPITSVTTESNLIFASSKSFWTRWTSRVRSWVSFVR